MQGSFYRVTVIQETRSWISRTSTFSSTNSEKRQWSWLPPTRAQDLNRRFPSCLWPLFQKASPSAKNIHMEMSNETFTCKYTKLCLWIKLIFIKTDLHIKGLALGLFLKLRRKATRRWAILLTSQKEKYISDRKVVVVVGTFSYTQLCSSSTGISQRKEKQQQQQQVTKCDVMKRIQTVIGDG